MGFRTMPHWRYACRSASGKLSLKPLLWHQDGSVKGTGRATREQALAPSWVARSGGGWPRQAPAPPLDPEAEASSQDAESGRPADRRVGRARRPGERPSDGGEEEEHDMWGMRPEGQNCLFHARLTVYRWKHGWNGTKRINHKFSGTEGNLKIFVPHKELIKFLWHQENLLMMKDLSTL
jgi:hypothetical protein